MLIELNRLLTTEQVRQEYQELPDTLAADILPSLPVFADQPGGQQYPPRKRG